MKEIKIKKILNLKVAISEMQANKIIKEMDFKEKMIFNFEGITDVTNTFFNILFDEFFNKLNSVNELIEKIKIKNYNDSIKFAFGDAFELFKERIEIWKK